MDAATLGTERCASGPASAALTMNTGSTWPAVNVPTPRVQSSSEPRAS